MEATYRRELTAVARVHAMDLVATATLLLCASIIAGRVWRFPFDDEIYQLNLVEHWSLRDLLKFSINGGDIHPPIPHIVFHMLHELGLGPAGMRLCSLAMTALSLVLLQLLTMMLIRGRTGAFARPATRVAAVLLFGLSPLAVGQGDALRWYPLFALLVALFLVMYLVPVSKSLRIASAVPLGLAASTNFLAAIVLAPFLVYRYLLERTFSRKFDAAYWMIVLLCAAPGLASFYALATRKLGHAASTELEHNIIRSTATLVIGFFGGGIVGVGQAWVLVPIALIACVAVWTEIDRNRPTNPTHLLLLTLAAATLMAIPGLDRGRAFLYLAPVLAAILTLYLDRRSAGSIVLLLVPVLLPAIAVVANADHGTRPFKRNAVIPYEHILDFIEGNAQGETLVMSSDPTVVWAMNLQGERPHLCVSYFMRKQECFSPDRRYDPASLSTNSSCRWSFIVRLAGIGNIPTNWPATPSKPGAAQKTKHAAPEGGVRHSQRCAAYCAKQ
jgi:hypothetical protein